MRRENRNKVGLWLPIGIGLILTMAGIRYLSSKGWIPGFGGNRELSYQTISTGASVQVGVPAPPNIPKPIPKPIPDPNPPDKMW